MRELFKDFIRRGLIASGFGPMILVVIYLILQSCQVLQMLTVNEVCLGIFSLSALAFVCGGMNCIYQVEQLPLMWAILIHGGVLYVSYMLVYLVNGWLQLGGRPIFVFTGVFILGYLVVWVVIYCIIRNRTARVNKLLRQKQEGLTTLK